MKKLFTIDAFAVAFVSALGYGFGDVFSRLLGWPEFLCILASIALGVGTEEVINRIAFRKEVQKNPAIRAILYSGIVLCFLIVHWMTVTQMGVSMMDYLLEQFTWVIGLPLLGFAVNLLIRGLRIRKIRSRYGDGDKGFVFDVKKEDIEETNQQNQPVSEACDSEYAVKTNTGIYVGEKNKKNIVYLGIPYAKPPVGKLRWKVPEPLPASDAVYEAKRFGASAIQVEHEGSILKLHRQSEDCLSLNICINAQKTEALKPVLVLFHPGDFTCGGSADPLVYGDNFINAHPDSVVVSFNYRLGIFGFIDFSKVPGGEAYPDTLNLGLLDQIAALKWIKENIAAFGGDPDNITAAGFESGATSLLLLAAGGHAQGLFQRAFVFNGLPEAAYVSTEGARALAKDLLKETNTASMEELLSLDTRTLKEAAQRLWRDMCAPTCDGNRIPAYINGAFREGKASGIEFIVGIPGNELQVYRSLIGKHNYEAFISAVVSETRNVSESPIAEEAKKYLELPQDETVAKARLAERCLNYCMYRSASALSEGGSKVHLLYWDRTPLIEKLGSGSVDAAAVLLGNEDASMLYGNVMNKDLSEILQKLLWKFMNREDLELYRNEIMGVDALNWDPFPQALTVSDETLQCGTIPSGKDRWMRA